MKKFSLRCAFGVLMAACAAFGASAQVDNYALSFTDNAAVANLGRVTELESPTGYTLQLWFNPSQWKQGASLVRCGKFSIKLGVNRALVFNDGTNSFSITASAIGVGKWTHLTLRTDENGTVATVNNSLKASSAAPLALPANEKSIWLGGDFLGRIDEVRLWKGSLPEDYNSFWQNTLNDLNPDWENLLAYWKLDQEQCANIVDYRGAHHGTLAPAGVSKVKVTDNKDFRYLINLAYGDISRYFDRAVDARHYSLSNRISMISGHFNPGTKTHYLFMPREDAEGSIQWLEEFGGRQGVAQLNGGDGLTVPGTALEVGSAPNATRTAPAGYAFETWIYPDELTADATLFAKGGMAVTFTAQGNIAVTIGESTYTSTAALPAEQWTHVGVSASGTSMLIKVGSENESLTCTAFAPSISDEKAVIGRGFKGKLDETMLWAAARTASDMAADSQRAPLADDKYTIKGNSAAMMAACYLYDLKDEPGYDSFSIDQCFRTMRSHTAGMRGVKFLLSLGANNFQEAFKDANVRAALGVKVARMVDDDIYDGLDLDFEWPNNQTDWNNVAALCSVIRQNLKPGKELSVSPHFSYYGYPSASMSDVDFFNFQIYGPNNIRLFSPEGFTQAVTNFRGQGFPDEKILMSYATTTNGGSNEAGQRVANTHPGFYPAGYAGLYNGNGPVDVDATKVYHTKNDCWYYLCGFNQTVWRAQQVVENGLGGIMYWDMGNDLPSSHEHSLARAASYALNSNVELLVTSVPSAAPAPAEDEFGPEATEDPEDQGGFNPEDAREAIAEALAVYARYPGYAAAGSAERATLLEAINKAHVGLADGASVRAAVEAYLSTVPAAISGPRNGVAYNVIGVNSYDNSRRYLYASNGSMAVVNRPADASDVKYQWTATVTDDGKFTLHNADGLYVTATTTLSDNAEGANAMPIVAGVSLGKLVLTMSDGQYFVTRYNDYDISNIGVASIGDKANDANNPKKWSAQWILEEVEPELLEPYTLSAEEGGLVLADGGKLLHGDSYYVDPLSEFGLTAMPTHMTHSGVTVDHDAKSIAVTYHGMSARKAYRLRNSNTQTPTYLAITDNMDLYGLGIEENPQQIFRVERMSDTKFALAAQGTYIGHEDTQNATLKASDTPAQYYVVKKDNNGVECFAFDTNKPNGGTRGDGSNAFMYNNGPITPWATGNNFAWWIPEEVSTFTLELQAIHDAYFAAVCLPFGVVLPEGVTAYSLNLDGSNLQSEDLGVTEIAANTPVLLKSDKAEVVLELTDAELAPYSSCDLRGSLFAAPASDGIYALGEANAKPAMVKASQLARNSAYVAAPGLTVDVLPITGDITLGIEEIESGVDAAPAAIYDLQGRRVLAPSKGIYIVNGKKTVIR